MSKFIHHERYSSDWMGEEDGIDVIETNDGFTVYQNAMAVCGADTLEEACEEAQKLLDDLDRQHTEEERQRIAEAREKKLFDSEAREIADLACFLINRRAMNFRTRYAAQGLLEHLIPILQERV